MIGAVPRIALTGEEFERHVQPELRLIRKGNIRLVPLRELDEWCQRNAERVLSA